MAIPENIVEKAKKIKLLALDVDGVLTRGDVIYTSSGEEIKIFNVKDGHGLSMLRASGFYIALITGRNSEITQRRADELGIQYVFQNIKRKLPIIQTLAEELSLTLSEILYMGDDTPDIPVLEVVGLSVCPKDAVEEVKRVCHYTTQSAGGSGAVREMTDLLMSVQLSAAKQEDLRQEASKT